MNLFLIDGNSYIYRAYYAIKGLSTSRGIPSNAIFGFTNMLLKIMREKKPDCIVISFDSPVPTKRHVVYKEYKAQRPEMPSDLVQQIPYIKEIITAFKIPIFEVPGYEADDVLATIALKASKQDIDTYIVTADKDMLQVVGDKIKIYDPMKDKILDERFIEERYGIKPEMIPDFMALAGDPIDNIPGVKGIGDKTAREILKDFRNIEELINNINKIKNERLKQQIIMNIENIKLSKVLSTLETSVPIDLKLSDLKVNEPDWKRLYELFVRLEFTSLLKYITPIKNDFKDYEIINSIDRLNEILLEIKEDISFDACLSDNNLFEKEIYGVGFCFREDKTYYLPIKHNDFDSSDRDYEESFLNVLSKILEDNKVSKIGYNIKPLIMAFMNRNINAVGEFYDVMIASYLLNPNKPNHFLEDIALEFLSYKKTILSELFGKPESIKTLSLDEIARFYCENASVIRRLKEVLFNKLKEEGLDSVYFNIEEPLIRVLVDMEMTGIKIDLDILNDISKELEREIESIKSRIYFMAGEDFNINSPKQLRTVLFENLGLKPVKKKKTGFSTEMRVLEELAQIHELPREILNYRTLSKLKSTYIDVLPTLINKKTGRIHTSFNQAATATGRLSSSEPNLQNIPVKGVWGTRIREAFIPEEEFYMLSADYSQVELRILAHLSSDKELIEAFTNNLDIHRKTASEIFSVKESEVTQEMRRVAKSVNFGVIYGISPFGLSETLGISKEEAKRYIDRYFDIHEGVRIFIEKTLNDARKNGYVKTFFGRKRPIPEINSKDANIRQQGERFAINSVIQGTAADIIKIAMIRIWNKFKSNGLKSRMLLQIHDELLFEVHTEELNMIKNIVKEEMENVVNFSIPLSVEINYGKNWAEAHI